MRNLLHYLIFKSLIPISTLQNCSASLDSLRALGESETVRVSRMGRQINAIRIRSPVQCAASRLAFLLHPVSKRGKYYFAEDLRTKLYIESGFDVVLFDFNGFGETPFCDLYFFLDLLSVLDHFASRNEGLIIVHGLSFGSYQIIPALERMPFGVGVILENTHRSLFDYSRNNRLGKMVLHAAKAFRFRPYVELDIQAAIRRLTRTDLEILGIACEEDTVTPHREMEEMLVDFAKPCQYVLFRKAPHLKAPRNDPKLYRETLNRFIDQLSSRNHVQCSRNCG